MYRILAPLSKTLLCLVACFTATTIQSQEPASAPPADVTVTGREATPWMSEQTWIGIPPAIEGAKIFFKASKDRPAGSDLKGNEVEFRVKTAGVVLVVSSWNYDGNASGNWYKTRLTHEKMETEGWVRLAKLTRISKGARSEYFLYRRIVKADETIRFHTRKYSPPVVIVPNEKQARAALAMEPWKDNGHPPIDRPIPEAARSLAATVDVTGFESRSLKSAEGWENVPEFLANAVIYDQNTKPRPLASAAMTREVEFTAKSDGLVAMAASWDSEGNATGDWQERRKTYAQLKQLGWTRFARVYRSLKQGRAKYDLLYRVVLKGDTFRFHTRKKGPPFVITLKPDQLKAVVSARMPLHSIKALRAGMQTASSNATTVILNTIETTSVLPELKRGMLLREIPRQAVLIAARDELGAATRDRTLREQFPTDKNGKFAPLDLMTTVTEAHELHMTLFRRTENQPDVLWDRVTNLPPGKTIPQLVQHVGRLSRTEFVQALKDGGVEGEPHKQVDTGAVPEKVVELQKHLGVFPQYEAVRRLHDVIRENGESPERLAALARGYAHLGSLTAAFRSPAHKAFKARALLYAERLLSRTGTTQWGLSQRAYVYVFVGLHKLALDDLKEAAKKPAGEGPYAEPVWVTTIEAFCTYDKDRLKKIMAAGETRPLARYLVMLSVNLSGSAEAIVRTCANALEDHPGCYRAIDMLCQAKSLGVLRSTAYQGPRYLATTLLDNILAVPHLPGDILRKVKLQKENGDSLDDMEFLAELIADLKKCTAPEKDAQEPSLAVLGQLITEVVHIQEFTQASFERFTISSNADRTIEHYAPVVAHHPYGPYLKRFHSNRTVVANALRTLAGRLNDIDEQRINNIMHFQINSVHPALWRRTLNATHRLEKLHADEIYRDMILTYIDPKKASQNAQLARRLVEVSPELPMSIRFLILHDWTTQRVHAAEWEKRYDDDPMVLMALADKFLASKENESGIRCLKRVIEVSQERSPYMRLAKLYQQQGKTDAWKQTLQNVLELPSHGLDNARVHNTLAKYHLEQKEYELAKEHGDAAARSGSGWGMMTAARVYTKLKDYRRAEQLVRTTSARYSISRLQWFYWCHRTGQGDVKAANLVALKVLQARGPQASVAQVREIGFFHLVTDEEDKARTLYQKIFSKTAAPKDAMYVIILADKAGDTQTRDQLLKQLQGAKIVSTSTPQGPKLKLIGRPSRHLATLLQAALTDDKKVQLDTKALDDLLKKLPLGYPTDLMYFAGLFLIEHEQKELGLSYLQRAAASPVNQYSRLLARHLLRAEKIKVDPERDVELKDRFKGPIEIVVQNCPVKDSQNSLR